MFDHIGGAPGRAWKISLGTFVGFIAVGVEVLSLSAGLHAPSLAAANLGDGLVLVGILGAALSGLAAWTGRESNAVE